MLRVELQDTSDTTFLRVEGRLAGAFAEDTRTMMLRRKLASALVVDLSDVTFVDDSGEELLSWLARIGARFVANSCYASDVCERLQLPVAKRKNAVARGRVC